MQKMLLINVVVVAVAIVGIGWWCDVRSQVIAERAIVRQENRKLEFWRERLLPVYQQMGVEHNENPATKADLFDPLIRLLKTQQK